MMLAVKILAGNPKSRAHIFSKTVKIPQDKCLKKP